LLAGVKIRTFFSKLQAPKNREKVWSREDLPSVEEDCVKEHLNKPVKMDVHKLMAAPTSAGRAGQ